MPRSRAILLACLLLLLVTDGRARDDRLVLDGGSAGSVRRGAPPAVATTVVDTTVLLGGPDRLDGRFENHDGYPNWQGWTHVDVTAGSESVHWHVSDFMAPGGQFAMWCGDTFAGGDPGYGNYWQEVLVFSHEVADNTQSSTVHWLATLRYDVELSYDYVYLEVNRGGTWSSLQTLTGTGTLMVDEMLTIAPADYVGDGADEIQLRVRVDTDEIYSDADGLWDTDGACQFDDVEVLVDDVLVDAEDFEDQVSDRWHPDVLGGVGDFAQILTNLQDEDPCHSNWSPQVIFVDDGIVVPGTGGTWCTTWCYGPGGYIVNNSGGLLGPPAALHNRVVSPAIAWPDGVDAAILEFDVYVHEELGSASTWPGIFYQWHVRSVDTGDPADLEHATWKNRNLLGYGGPEYRREHEPISDLIVAGATHLQVGLSVLHIRTFAWYGEDGTPAPYFDNVRVAAYPYEAPVISAVDIDLFQDSFPASGTIDGEDLASNSVRLDMARNISPPEDLRNDPGDSIVVDVRAVRDGSVLDDLPRLHVAMRANRDYRDLRQLPAGFTLHADALETGDLVVGTVSGDSTYSPTGGLIEDRYHFDLPDTGFFYPGDRLHYYIEATDNVFGDIGTAILPADTAGFSSFDPQIGSLRYDNLFTVRALPGTRSNEPDDHPMTLFWNDHDSGAAHDAWLEVFDRIMREEDRNFDIYCTNGPTAGAGNGLGGRATADQLASYRNILYTAGDLNAFLLGNGDHEVDPSDDLGVLMEWIDQSSGNLFACGDDLVSYLTNAGAEADLFRTDYLGVDLIAGDVRQLIDSQTAPRVVEDVGWIITPLVDQWVAYGGCPRINDFDAIVPRAGRYREAQFTDPAGNPGVYEYAAAVVDHNSHHEARHVVVLPYDLLTVFTAPGWTPPQGYVGWSARDVLLHSVLSHWGDWPPPPGVAPDAPLTVRQYPNPFNPATTIALDLPRSGEVRVKIFDVRGQLVRTLLDERLTAGHHEIVWNGTDGRGAAAASGVYFYELRAAGQVRMGKLALIK